MNKHMPDAENAETVPPLRAMMAKGHTSDRSAAVNTEGSKVREGYTAKPHPRAGLWKGFPERSPGEGRVRRAQRKEKALQRGDSRTRCGRERGKHRLRGKTLT